jgi:predicted GNAT family acetyltransferase
VPDTVRDNPALSRFELDHDGRTAVAYYQLTPGVITLRHTEVPPEMSGQGIGSQLVRGVLEAARARGLKVVRSARSWPPIWPSTPSSTICCFSRLGPAPQRNKSIASPALCSDSHRTVTTPAR